MYDLYSDIALDVLAPLHTPGIMTIDMISVASVGKLTRINWLRPWFLNMCKGICNVYNRIDLV